MLSSAPLFSLGAHAHLCRSLVFLPHLTPQGPVLPGTWCPSTASSRVTLLCLAAQNPFLVGRLCERPLSSSHTVPSPALSACSLHVYNNLLTGLQPTLVPRQSPPSTTHAVAAHVSLLIADPGVSILFLRNVFWFLLSCHVVLHDPGLIPSPRACSCPHPLLASPCLRCPL